MGYRMVDAPDLAVRVGEDENFTSLMPGESWTMSRQLQSESWSSIPDGRRVPMPVQGRRGGLVGLGRARRHGC